MAKMTPEFQTAFDTFFKGCEAIYTEYCDRNEFTLRDEFSYTVGRRYVKVIYNHSVHSFIDMNNGDVLKPASFKAPAKHARGNLFDEKNGLAGMGPHGPAYLR